MKKQFYSLFIALAITSGVYAGAEPATIGVVNFNTCITDSKLGKQEQASFESLKKQMSSLIEETDKQLNEISSKFNDPDYMDGLSPEAGEELKNKFRGLSEEMNRYQNQYYQVLQQANMKILQHVGGTISLASEKIAKEKKLNMVVNKDAFFYFAPTLEVTTAVINEMDKTFEEAAKQEVATTEEAAK